jgi:hypothetical protein
LWDFLGFLFPGGFETSAIANKIVGLSVFGSSEGCRGKENPEKTGAAKAGESALGGFFQFFGWLIVRKGNDRRSGRFGRFGG